MKSLAMNENSYIKDKTYDNTDYVEKAVSEYGNHPITFY